MYRKNVIYNRTTCNALSSENCDLQKVFTCAQHTKQYQHPFMKLNYMNQLSVSFYRYSGIMIQKQTIHLLHFYFVCANTTYSLRFIFTFFLVIGFILPNVWRPTTSFMFAWHQTTFFKVILTLWTSAASFIACPFFNLIRPVKWLRQTKSFRVIYLLFCTSRPPVTLLALFWPQTTSVKVIVLAPVPVFQLGLRLFLPFNIRILTISFKYQYSRKLVSRWS